MTLRRRFTIWMEGYAATGDSSSAQIVGESFGEDFDDAVRRYIAENEGCGIVENTRDRYINDVSYKNRKSNWNIWACNLFDNEFDARQSFG